MKKSISFHVCLLSRNHLKSISGRARWLKEEGMLFCLATISFISVLGGEGRRGSIYHLPIPSTTFKASQGYCMFQPLFCPFLVRQSVYISRRGIQRDRESAMGGGKRRRREAGKCPPVYKAAITTV